MLAPSCLTFFKSFLKMLSPLVLIRATKQKIRRDVECSNFKATLPTDRIQLRMYVQAKE